MEIRSKDQQIKNVSVLKLIKYHLYISVRVKSAAHFPSDRLWRPVLLWALIWNGHHLSPRGKRRRLLWYSFVHHRRNVTCFTSLPCQVGRWELKPPAFVSGLCIDILHVGVVSGFPPGLKIFLEDESIKKVGLGIGGDKWKLLSDYEIKLMNFVELSDLANEKVRIC